MTIKELKELLKDYPNDMDVIMSKDEEGNGFSPLADHGDGLYVAESTWSGEVYNLDEREDAEAHGKEIKKVLVLWPTN